MLKHKYFLLLNYITFNIYFNMNAIDSAFLTNEEKEELNKIVINSYNCKENI